ncbi:MAG: DNA mismatch repair protein MutL, partial [Candidatus Omnitrophota bacterium]
AKTDVIDELVKMTSCRAAIKAGEKLNGKEMISLLTQLEKCELPFTCPHGRPTSFEITADELEKRFRRK